MSGNSALDRKYCTWHHHQSPPHISHSVAARHILHHACVQMCPFLTDSKGMFTRSINRTRFLKRFFFWHSENASNVIWLPVITFSFLRQSSCLSLFFFCLRWIADFFISFYVGRTLWRYLDGGAWRAHSTFQYDSDSPLVFHRIYRSFVQFK